MATNNLLVNNESRVLHDVQKRIERSLHNISQSRKFPCEVGIIYPFFCRKTLPSDSFKISAEILIKQLQPLLVPQMVSFTVNTAFYWVDYNLAFPQFEYFLINQRGQQDLELPYVRLLSHGSGGQTWLLPPISSSPSGSDSQFPFNVNLRPFLDITASGSNEKVDALPFWTYNTIIRDFYLNIDRLSESEYNSWFPKDPTKWQLRPGVNYGIGDYELSGSGLTGEYVYFDKLRPHNVRGDYFVNSYPTPLRGDIPTLSVSSEVGSLTADFNATISSANIEFDNVSGKQIGVSGAYGTSIASGDFPILVEGVGDSDTAVSTLQYQKDGNVYGLSTKASPEGSANVNVWNILNSNFAKLKSNYTRTGQISLTNLSNLQQSFAITSRQLRLLESLTRKREIDILMKPRLKNYLQTYFGVNRYKDDSLYQPVFIGSTSQRILINDIAQTSATSDSPLGRQGATAMSLGSGYVGEYYCRNYGCLMGVMYILPDYDYEPALPREWCERTPDDFVNPEYTHLSMQPILNKELFVSNDSTWNNEVLGYGGMYDNYRTSQNLVCGQFLDSNMSDVRQFAQVRRFSNNNKPEITTAFLDSNKSFDKTVFSVPSLPPFIAQCVARVEAVRPIPEVAIPRDS